MLPNQDHLKIISSCPVCESQNFPAQVKLLTEKEDSHLLHIQCRKCKSCILVLITAGPQGMVSMGLLTDLKSEEVLKFSQGAPITSDDVIDVYEIFSKDSTNFLALI